MSKEQDVITTGSLFSGIGGFEVAASWYGIKCLWQSEIEPWAVELLKTRFPDAKQLGDICGINGAEIPPVDIITFGSPCQDMSVAGARKGMKHVCPECGAEFDIQDDIDVCPVCGAEIEKTRSGLFMEAIRIIREMRRATNGIYPNFIIWENVPGAFTSNRGMDFRAVLEEITETKIPMPASGRWANAGVVRGGIADVAWRVLDAQYWGVPQRRKRIYLVADFRGQRAGKILFKSESVSRYPPKGGCPWKRTAEGTQDGIGKTGTVCLNDQGGNRIDVTEDITSTLRAESHHPPCVADAAGFCTEHSANSRSIGYEQEVSPSLRAGTVPATVYENHGQDTRFKGPLDTAPTVNATYGTGGNNQPFVVENTKCYDVRFTSEGTKNARQNCYETDKARTIDTGGNAPDSNQGGVAVVCVDQGGSKSNCCISKDISPTLACTHGGEPAVCVQGSMIGRKNENGPQGSGINEDVSFTLNATDKHAVATDYKDPPIINDTDDNDQYIVRRLTPTECARLQGFPADWHKGIVNAKGKEMPDSAAYKGYGNAVATVCAEYPIQGIYEILSKEERK